MSALSKAKFWAALLPDMLALAQVLYRLFDGDASLARTEIRRIRDHGERLARAGAGFEERLSKVKDPPA